MRGRKLKHEWVMEDIDTGGDMSSLGMSILSALVFGFWHGSRTRIFVSCFHTAMIGVWINDGYTLIDPSSSRENAITLNFEDSLPTVRKIKKGSFLEVKQISKWKLAVVERVIQDPLHPRSTSVVVRMVASGKRRGVALSSSSAWRHLTTDDTCDVEQVLTALLKSGKGEGGEVEWPCPGEKRPRH